ncbi:MAG: T9SS type A sorting domain-containing protein [Saprospiraceae bacterium]|nr:T9SS type A sorting domain-containing protein [Saprospiraceae bacterium]
MTKFTQFIAILFVATLAFQTQAQNIAKVAEQEEVIFVNEDKSLVSTKLTTDKKPKFKKWQKEYSLDKIEYHEDATIIHFRFDSDYYTHVSLYSASGHYPWTLKAKSGETFELKGVYNIKHNGTLVAKEIEGAQVDIPSNRKHTVITCEVHFDRLPMNLREVDMIEGLGTEQRSNHFHVLDIKLKTPKIIEEVEVEEVEVEEITSEAVSNESNENTLLITTREEFNWTVYPNPTSDLIQVERQTASDATIEVMNLSGQSIYSMTTQDRISTIDMSEYAAGAYIISLTTSDKTTAQKVIVK